MVGWGNHPIDRSTKPKSNPPQTPPYTYRTVQVTACCFDKTGTLTADDLVMRGIVLPFPSLSNPSASSSTEPDEAILPPAHIQGPPLWVLAGCHSLMTLDGRVVGDPMERAAVEGLGWSVAGSGDLVLPPPLGLRGQEGERDGGGDWAPIRIHHRWAFSSALRRMSVLASRSAPLLAAVRCWVSCICVYAWVFWWLG